jgi:hypothetical protein
MTYREFKRLVKEAGWTLAEMRFDVRPPEELLRLLDRLGLKKYERYQFRRAADLKIFPSILNVALRVPDLDVKRLFGLNEVNRHRRRSLLGFRESTTEPQ